MDYKAIIQAKRNLIDRKTNERRAEADQDAEELRILEAMEEGQAILDGTSKKKMELEREVKQLQGLYDNLSNRVAQAQSLLDTVSAAYNTKASELQLQLTPLQKAVDNAKQELADTHGKIEQLSKQHADLVKQHKAEIDKIKADFDEWKRIHRL